MTYLKPQTLLYSLVLLTLGGQAVAAETALDRYVAAPDPAYKFELVKTLPGEGYTAYVIELTSQSWRSEKEVNRTVWKHWLTIVQPAKVKFSTGFLFITGGNNKDKAPEKLDPWFVEMSLVTGTVTAELRMVPNQPLVFADDPEKKERVEDAIIAYTWDKFLRGGDDQWPLRLPMTKSAVRAMDTITAFCKQQSQVAVDKFVVAGGSKRGWTTWTTAAVDKRVVAIVPLVIDMLNIEPSFVHHYQAYGFWAPAVKDYVDYDIMGWSGTARYKELMKIEEPYQYRDRLTIPKYIVNAAGDQFFLPDSSQFYFNDLIGEKHLRYTPNADHSLRGSDARESVLAFYEMILNGKARPEFFTSVEADGSIRITAREKPLAVKLWQANNTEARDFRMEKIGKAYKETALEDKGDSVYVARIPKPEKGWTAAFVEITFPSGGKYPIKFTTGVQVVPDVLPHPEVPKATH